MLGSRLRPVASNAASNEVRVIADDDGGHVDGEEPRAGAHFIDESLVVP